MIFRMQATRLQPARGASQAHPTRPPTPIQARPSRRAMMVALPLGLGLLSQSAQALELPNKEVDDAQSPFIQELLKRTDEKRDERREQRLKDYYRRNFKEYFEFEANSKAVAAARGIKPETQEAIAKWLKENQ